jgi:hypothetical protein
MAKFSKLGTCSKVVNGEMAVALGKGTYAPLILSSSPGCGNEEESFSTWVLKASSKCSWLVFE